jgi:hypothetical protein
VSNGGLQGEFVDLTSTLSFFDKFHARQRATCGVADLAVSMDRQTEDRQTEDRQSPRLCEVG